jgi:predicted dehydrogenase
LALWLEFLVLTNLLENITTTVIEEHMDNFFKICLIGCGGMAIKGHGPSLVKYQGEHTGIVLAGCCDLFPEKAEQFKNQFGFLHAYSNYVEMVEKEKPDLTLCITPTQITARVVIDILKRGYNVLLEKPPGLDKEEALAIHNAALLAGASARVAFNRRYMPLIVSLKNEIRDAKIIGITCNLMRIDRLDEDFSTTAIHGIDTVKYLADSEYEELQISQTSFSQEGKIVKNIGLQGHLKNNAFCNLTFFPCSGVACESYSVITPDRTFIIELPSQNELEDAGKITIVEKNKIVSEIKGAVAESFITNGFFEETAGFASSLILGEQLGSDIETGVTSVEIANCIRKNKQYYSN